LQVFVENARFLRQVFLLGPIFLGVSSCQADSVSDGGIRSPATIAAAACELQARIIGALSADIAWTAADSRCEGMPRPGGRGARLRFSGTAAEGDRPIAIIIALPDLVRNEAASELASNVTLIEEGSGRFFSTANLDICMTDVHSMTALAGSVNQSGLSGTVYCVAPLAEVNGRSSVSIPRLAFTGFIDWGSR
jgi:hypothetical protein